MISRERALDVAGQRLELGRLARPRRAARSNSRDQVRLARRRSASSRTRSDALDEDPQRPVGDLDHLVDDRRRCRPRRGRPSRAPRSSGSRDGDEREHPVAGDDVVDSWTERSWPTASGVSDSREDDRLLQRQDRQRPPGSRRRSARACSLEAQLAHRALLDRRSRRASAAAALGHDRQRDRQHARARSARSRAAGRRPRRARSGAGTGRTRSPSAGRRGPSPRRRGALAGDDERALADDDLMLVGSTPGSSTTTCSSGGSSVRIAVDVAAGSRARRPAKRGTCQRSAKSSSISSCSRSMSFAAHLWSRSGTAGGSRLTALCVVLSSRR